MVSDHGTWVKVLDDGTVLERDAHTAADEVRFRFDGWLRREPLPPVQVPQPVLSAAVTPRAAPAKATGPKAAVPAPTNSD